MCTDFTCPLCRHPDVFVACEVHFFDLYWDMGLNWYRSHLRASKRLVGEKTPELIYVDECAVRMKEVSRSAASKDELISIMN